ncbi:hypothetical protein [Methanoculleus receptaculi]|uniref:Roadblock/LAMTOR2 domain-containing protein n=1 Tax=Methanoculleus receptaculi TaxID=394967 RepID=A0AAX4FWL0_9EURY|nr:hypothetical protein [Methanoculleus receptaculi]WOX58259.1 hypothetical protein R6Y96_03185 [Methanoculleus receptaculi]
MDSTGIIQFFLILLTIITTIGFAAITYYLAEISRVLNMAGSPQVPLPPAETLSPARKEPLIEPGAMGSLEEALGLISRKYGLESITLATTDGLLIASTKPGSEDDAARYSHLYLQGKLRGENGIELLGMSHRGETVIAITRSSAPLSDDQRNALEKDIQNTLQHWV